MSEFSYDASAHVVDIVRHELTDTVRGYLEAAMFCDAEYSPPKAVFASSAVARAYGECSRFLHDNYDLVWNARCEGQTFVQIGRDLWFTRNGHGVGFWDRGLGDLGEQLTEAAKAMGSQDIYLGDDGFVYLT